jgi:hypothetical protein
VRNGERGAPELASSTGGVVAVETCGVVGGCVVGRRCWAVGLVSDATRSAPLTVLYYNAMTMVTVISRIKNKELEY